MKGVCFRQFAGMHYVVFGRGGKALLLRLFNQFLLPRPVFCQLFNIISSKWRDFTESSYDGSRREIESFVLLSEIICNISSSYNSELQ